MSRAKFEAARELITEKRYDEARVILRTVSHPTAAKWLQKLDQLNPPFPAVTLPPDNGIPAYEADLRRWVEVEKTVHVFGALLFVLIAAYLWIADPLREFATTFLFYNVTALEIAIAAPPTLCVIVAALAVWRTTHDNWMRKYVLSMKPVQLSTSASLCYFLASINLIRGIFQSGWQLSLGFSVLLVLAGVSLNWRSKQAQRLRSKGYVDP